MNLEPRLLKWARQASFALALTILCGVAGGVLVVLQARQITHIVSGAFLGGADGRALAPAFLLLLLIIGLRAAASFGADAAANESAMRVKTRLRILLARHLVELGPGALSREKTAELANTAIQGVEALDAYFSQYLPQLALAGLIPLVVLIVVFPVDVLTGVVLALTAPLIPLFMVLIGKASEAVTRRQWNALSRLSAFFLDSLQGLRELKQFGQSRQRGIQIDAAAERHRNTTMQVLRVTFLSALALELVGTISTAIIAVEIGLRLLYGGIPFEDAFFILLLAPDFYLPLRMLGQRFHAAMNGISAAKRIFELLEMSGAPVEISPTSPVDLRAPFIINFERVSFHYPEQENPALEDMTFEIRLGEKVALVGPSGAGKSTIARLLLRFIQPEAGDIKVNGLPLRQVNLESWRNQVAWVPQQPCLLHDSAANNISPMADERRSERLAEAVRQAQLEGVFSNLPGGLESSIGESGERLSGGEAQRLALARAFYVDAPLLILDEPSGSLDPLNEALLEESTNALLRGKTALIIAHRLSTVVNADRILVVDGGRIVESGTHTELLARRGAYFEMVQAFGGRA